MNNILTKTFKAVSDNQRILILAILINKPMFVCQLAQSVQLSYSTTSQHLHILSDVGLIKFQKQGRWVQYSIDQNSLNPFKDDILKMVNHLLKTDSAFKVKLKEIINEQQSTVC